MTEKEKSRQEIVDMVAIITATIPKIENAIMDCFKQIYNQSMSYRFFKDRFSFNNNKALYEQIISSFRDMSDITNSSIKEAVMLAISKIDGFEMVEIDDNIILTHLDSYGNTFKNIAEGFIIAAIINNVPFNETWLQFKIYKDTPLLAPMIVKTPKAVNIIEKTINSIGSGNYISIFSNMQREVKSVIATYFAKAKAGVMGRGGYKWYKCYRNSNYDCPICDDVCAVPHRITDIVLPVHPNCICGMYPINSLEEF
jgi:hypothetical protein